MPLPILPLLGLSAVAALLLTGGGRRSAGKANDRNSRNEDVKAATADKGAVATAQQIQQASALQDLDRDVTDLQRSAMELEVHLMATRPGSESPTMVRAFQAQAAKSPSLDTVTKADGLYGPGVALALARVLGRDPPLPRQWPRGTSVEQSRAKYQQRLVVELAKGEVD